MAPKKNQYQHELPPLDLISDHILVYWKMCWPVTRIWKEIKAKHLDTERYSIGLTKFREYVKAMGLKGSNAQKHTPELLKPIVEELRVMFPNAGVVEMRNLLFHEQDISVSRPMLWKYFKQYEPELIKKRKARNLKRKQFYSAGVNDMWAMDQHDKWKYKFGLALHICIDSFTGIMKWLKIWWTNSNPCIVVSYYLEVIRTTGVTCLVTQSDLGTENVGVANCHTVLRHLIDPSLEGTIQHRYMADKKNIIPEIGWSQLRRRWTPGFEDLLDYGVNQGWYDSENTLKNLVFRWVFIPWLQAELDSYRNHINLCSKRSDKNKVLPHGVPSHIEKSPESYGAVDFGIEVEARYINTIAETFAPSDHPVFQLVPPSFAEMIGAFYITLESPTITRSNVWDIYLALLEKFRACEDTISSDTMQAWNQNCSLARDSNWGQDDFEKIEGEPLIDVAGYLGGVNGGAGPAYSDNNEQDSTLSEADEEYIHEEPEIQIVFDSDDDAGE
ncbi:hypothetical protein FB446DRAFT_786925 [Lentinula raphanica]|nr:hypothetical protein FB446DRAFT_786925 [Lentinula raphanica]